MRRSLICAGVALATAGSAGPGWSQGSMVMTHSSCAVATGAAGVGSPCEDGSAVLFNPAGLVRHPSVVGLGASAIRSGGSFEYDNGGEIVEREASTSTVPFAYLNYNLRPNLSAAIGLFAPYGLGIDWPESFEGRFVSYDTGLRNLYLQPTLSVAAGERLSFGAGLDVIFSSIEINQRLDLSTTPLPTNPLAGQGRVATFGSVGIATGTDFADVNLSGTGTGLSFHVGALARITDQISIGARYLHSAAIDLDGDADFSQVLTNLTLPAGNPLSQPGNSLGLPAGSAVVLDPVLGTSFQAGQRLADQAISTNLELPAQLVVGVAVTPIPALTLLADYQFTGWESFDQATIDFEQEATPDAELVLDYQNTSTWRFGARYDASPSVILRGGFIYNTAAEREFSVSPLLPEAERNYYSGGLGWRFGNEMQLDLGYQLVDQSDRRGRVRGRAPGMAQAELEALNVGVYSSTAHIFSATLSFQFGGDR